MISLSDAVTVGAGAILVILGIVVAAFQRNHVGFFFAAFCTGYGLGFAKAGLTQTLDYTSFASVSVVSDLLGGAGFLLGATGLMGLALHVPSGTQRARPSGILAAGIAGGALAVWAYVALAPLYPRWAIGALNALNIGTIIFAFVVFPLRFAAQPVAAVNARRTLALLASGLALILAGQGGDLVIAARGGQFVLLEIGATTAALLAAPLWLRATRGPDARLARNVALLIPGALLLTMLVPGETRASYYAPGLVSGALLLAYAVLRGEIEGLDLKIRFAISKSTIAAVFIAVFFVASEAAQQFFGDTLGSTYVGIAAAGALVFAIAPLQRAAERLAERAVPIPSTRTSSSSAPSDKEAAYKRAVRLALRDRTLTPEEEIHLHEVAEHMGIGAGRAMALRVEAEREERSEGAT